MLRKGPAQTTAQGRGRGRDVTALVAALVAIGLGVTGCAKDSGSSGTPASPPGGSSATAPGGSSAEAELQQIGSTLDAIDSELAGDDSR